jgi:hypothetical protein
MIEDRRVVAGACSMRFAHNIPTNISPLIQRRDVEDGLPDLTARKAPRAR